MEHLTCLFVGATAKGPDVPVMVHDLIQFRRFFGEGVADHTGPPGALARGLWGFFRAGGARALVVSTGPDPEPGLPEVAEAVGEAVQGGPVPALVVIPGLPREPGSVPRWCAMEVPWPDPSPMVFLDAAKDVAKDRAGMVALAREVAEAGLGRYRLVTPRAVGNAPVAGRSMAGLVSPGALAAGLVSAGGVSRIAGSGITVPRAFTEREVGILEREGVVVLLPTGRGGLTAAGLPRWPHGPKPGETWLTPEQSPFGDLITHLTEDLAHHAHQPWDPGLFRRIERDAMASLARFFGRSARGYRVICDEELNPPRVRAEGKVVVQVILAPPLPVVREVVLRLTLT